jgi:hypothetical protein
MFVDYLDQSGLSRASYEMAGADTTASVSRVQLANAIQEAWMGGVVEPIFKAELLASVRTKPPSLAELVRHSLPSVYPTWRLHRDTGPCMPRGNTTQKGDFTVASHGIR